MSAPRTNLEKQERRHRPVLIVLRILIVGAVVALIGYAVVEMLASDESPDGGLTETIESEEDTGTGTTGSTAPEVE